MAVQNRVVQKLSDIFRNQANLGQNPFIQPNLSVEQKIRANLRATGEWFSAIAALEQLLLSTIYPCATNSPVSQGLILSGPAAILSHPELTSYFYSGVFTPDASRHLALMPCQIEQKESQSLLSMAELPLLPQDPIATEQFCLVLTAHFGLLMVLGKDEQGINEFEFSFDPEVIQQGWLALRSRLLLSKHPHLAHLEALNRHFTPPVPDYRLVMEFSRQLLKNLPDLSTPEPQKNRPINEPKQKDSITFNHDCLSPDIELLQALTHEIRTPLTTIRTMTRLLLKRAKLNPEMAKCLEVIDQECTEQINRMELIFRAAEWKTSPVKEKQVQLVPISVDQVFEQSIPRWKKQAQRRNIVLDVIMPQKLPQVVSDPAMLEQMLTGLMEKFTRTIPIGGQIRVEVTTAGNQLKLQFHTESSLQNNPFKALGQLLLFQPDTGSLSLNLDITKNLFQALGGKLIVRQGRQQGEVLTVFLPLGGSRVRLNNDDS